MTTSSTSTTQSGSAWPEWSVIAVRLAAMAVVCGALLVVMANYWWPDNEGLGFDVVYSVGMLGVNAAWLVGWMGRNDKGVLDRGVAKGTPAVLGWAIVAIAVGEGIFW